MQHRSTKSPAKGFTQGFTGGDLLDGKYRIDRQLGQGGMGAVYSAIHLGTKRTVAVKVIHPQFSNHQEFVERFRREAEAAGRLRHPNVVDVTDFGFAQTDRGQVAYLVMEYLDGCTLAEVLSEERRLPPVWVVEVLEQVCSAVDEAHRLGIIHRDLKPDNIWLEPNRRGGYTIKVLDFGLVKLDPAQTPAVADAATRQAEATATNAALGAEMATSVTLRQVSLAAAATRKDASEENAGEEDASEEATTLIKPPTTDAAGSRDTDTGRAFETAETAGDGALTRVGSLMGTPLYMSPEQCRGERLDARSDIYSLGVIAYRLLCGEPPFSGDIETLLKQHATAAPPPLRQKHRRVPRKVARLVMQALAKDPAARPASAAGFAAALRASVEGSGALLRQAVSLYSERFPTFFKVSLLAYAPVLAVLALLELSSKLAEWGQLTPATMNLFAPLLILAMIVTNLLAYSMTVALTVPLVTQIMIAPLRPARLRTALATLKRRWLVFSLSSVVVLALVLLGAALFLLPGGVVIIAFALYEPVAVMERLGVFATLRRATRLLRRSWSTVLIITVLQFTLPVLVWIASIDASFTFRLDDNFSPKELGFHLGFSNRSHFYQLLNIFVTPLTAIMTALLYLKTRSAGGESLQDAIAQFEALEIPSSNWQARLRSRASLNATANYQAADRQPPDS